MTEELKQSNHMLCYFLLLLLLFLIVVSFFFLSKLVFQNVTHQSWRVQPLEKQSEGSSDFQQKSHQTLQTDDSVPKDMKQT